MSSLTSASAPPASSSTQTRKTKLLLRVSVEKITNVNVLQQTCTMQLFVECRIPGGVKSLGKEKAERTILNAFDFLNATEEQTLYQDIQTSAGDLLLQSRRVAVFETRMHLRDFPFDGQYLTASFTVNNSNEGTEVCRASNPSSHTHRSSRLILAHSCNICI